MKAPQEIRQVWNRFGGVPMETFTKGWWYRRSGGTPRQRTVDEMGEHRRAYGAGGNCFDLALWLRHDLQRAGIPARIAGHDLCTANAHVAVIATDRSGREYLCDLGDQWLQPIRIDTASAGWHGGFFPSREVQVSRTGDLFEVLYRRTNGKVSRQSYDLRPLPADVLAEACHHSQNLLRRPFCEVLLPHPATGTVEHWEYDRGASFWNLANGPVLEEPCSTREEWVARIGARTGLSAALIASGFAAYQGV